MWLRSTALAVFAAASCLSAWAQPPEILTLDEAFARVAQSHPDLRLIDGQRKVLSVEAERAALRPVWVAGLQIENAFGTGDSSGFRQAEISLTLAGVLERGGKLDARRALAQTRIDSLALQRETKRLDLLAEVARRYLAISAAQDQRRIADLDVAQRQRTVAGARQRLAAGASPESVVLTAQAALARAELDRDRAQQRSAAARQHLAALWGERNPAFGVVAGDPLVLPEIADFAALDALLTSTPELARFADEQRIGEARLQLARSQTTPDLDWQVGVRRLQATDDFALVGSVSVPLGSSRRAQPDIRIAEAELALVEIEREAQGLSLYSTLSEAHGRYRVAQLEVSRLQADVLPKLAKAERAAERAYRGGAISYLEWAQLQSERTSTRKQQLEAALEAQRALIEIQRLTGQAFVAGPASQINQETTP
ncbi:TolC family protein [Pseudoxanthomonas sacheonensis]|uniref:Cobalt-zinc-cadmium efflux system outer membrane protein n=1 Tax=Pseudoxanthomonas sacheonensis TaxID=443615 RepID=A0ABU1RTA1_9GAMM|nr:TolC family protein [Pseudoxanthomonas sacheonensis]MDR6842011.1 cobalt-zinc-cadmium efflux system outer membrane protein [Pseudoxanthomonas sacheonensis]